MLTNTSVPYQRKINFSVSFYPLHPSPSLPPSPSLYSESGNKHAWLSTVKYICDTLISVLFKTTCIYQETLQIKNTYFLGQKVKVEDNQVSFYKKWVPDYIVYQILYELWQYKFLIKSTFSLRKLVIALGFKNL